MGVDPTKGWEHLWRDDAVIQRGWNQPSPVVVAIAEDAWRRGARSALDLGCGPGRHAVALARIGFETSATDVSPTALTYCARWLAAEGLSATLREADMRSLPFGDGSFDLVVSYNVIYHATRAGVAATLDEIFRVMSPGGTLFVTFIGTNDGKFGEYQAKTQAGSGVELEPRTYRIPNDPDEDGDLPHHFVDEAEIRDLLQRFTIKSLVPVTESRLDSNGNPYPKEHWHAIAGT